MTGAVVALSADARANHRELTTALASGPGTVSIPSGDWAVCDGLVVGRGVTLRGEGPDSRLRLAGSAPAPLVQVLGSGSAVRDLTLVRSGGAIGLHAGDVGTAITVGRYLYSDPPPWIEDVVLAGLVVERPARERTATTAVSGPANSIALMGAVRDVEVRNVDVNGGGTGLAVHWGAVARSVSDITGPSYHPHRLTITGLRVRHAYEGFYLSSAHDVVVRGAELQDVEIGFRLLPGDNTTRFADDEALGQVNSRITVEDCTVRWNGPLFGVRIAGWGRSEVDGQVTRVPYRDTVVRRCRLETAPLGSHLPGRHDRTRAVVVLEHASGLALEDLTFVGGAGLVLVQADSDHPLTLGGLTVSGLGEAEDATP